jgi:hypothetical protein
MQISGTRLLPHGKSAGIVLKLLQSSNVHLWLGFVNDLGSLTPLISGV